MKLETLMTSHGSLVGLARLSVPINVSFRLSLFLDEIGPVIEKAFKKQNEIAKKHDGKITSKKAIAERDALYAEEVNIEVPTITVAELEGVSMAAGDLVALKWLITK